MSCCMLMIKKAANHETNNSISISVEYVACVTFIIIIHDVLRLLTYLVETATVSVVIMEALLNQHLMALTKPLPPTM